MYYAFCENQSTTVTVSSLLIYDFNL